MSLIACLCLLTDCDFILEFRMAASGMAWMNSETREVVTVPASDIKWAAWMRVARNYRLRIGMKDATNRRQDFDGFQRDVSHGCVTIEKILMTV